MSVDAHMPPRSRAAIALTVAGSAALLVVATAALVLLIIDGPGWFSVGRLAGFLTAIAFGAAFFSAAAGRDSAVAARRSAAVAATAALTARRAYGQQLFELARSVHADLTTGQVAEARDRIVGLSRARQKLHGEPLPPASTLESETKRLYEATAGAGGMIQVRRDWFTVLWCLQRIHAALVLLGQASLDTDSGHVGPRDFLIDLIRPQIASLNDDATHLRAALEEYFQILVDDEQSTRAFGELVSTITPETTVGRWADPCSTNVGEALYNLVRGDGNVRLGDLTDDQFLALHQAVYLPDGARSAERIDFSRRLRGEAQGVDDDRGITLRRRADKIEAAAPDGDDPPTP